MLKYMKQNLTDLKEVYKSTTIDFVFLFELIKQDRKISKNTRDLNNTINKDDLIHIYKTLPNNGRIHILLKYT